MSTEPHGTGQGTFGAFIDSEYAPWALANRHEEDAAARLKSDFPDWLAEPLNSLNAERIEGWRRGRLEEHAQPIVVNRQLQALASCLRKAVEWRQIEQNPLQDFNPGSEDRYLVELFAGGNGAPYLREGWSTLGAGWTWTSGSRASIELPYVKGDHDFVLKMGVVGINKSAEREYQRITIEVNDSIVGKVLCRGPTFYEFFVPKALLKSQQRLHVTLILPDSCLAHDSKERKDTRYLALRLAKIELQTLPKSRPAAAFEPAGARSPAELLEQRAALQDMASLGHNCEFGFVQRQAGAEPMGLFRWTSAPIDPLILALERRLEGFNDRDALDVRVDEQGVYIAENKIYGFWYHTFVNSAHGITPERVKRNEYIRIGLLSKSLIEELQGEKKLFVYHDAGTSKLADIRRLVRALNAYGKNTLLWLVSAPFESQVGTARQIEPGLIQGYVSGFQTGEIHPISPHVQSWVAAACQAHKIWRAARDGQGKSPPDHQGTDTRALDRNPAKRPSAEIQSPKEPVESAPAQNKNVAMAAARAVLGN